jgi:hypothetical protein
MEFNDSLDRIADWYVALSKIKGTRPRLTFEQFYQEFYREVKDRTERAVRDWATVDRLINRNKWAGK